MNKYQLIRIKNLIDYKEKELEELHLLLSVDNVHNREIGLHQFRESIEELNYMHSLAFKQLQSDYSQEWLEIAVRIMEILKKYGYY